MSDRDFGSGRFLRCDFCVTGIIMAGGCATGTYYRDGEGLIGSWVALVFYALVAAVMKYGRSEVQSGQAAVRLPVHRLRAPHHRVRGAG